MNTELQNDILGYDECYQCEEDPDYMDSDLSDDDDLDSLEVINNNF